MAKEAREFDRLDIQLGVEMEIGTTSLPCTGFNMSKSGILIALHPRFHALLPDNPAGMKVSLVFAGGRKSASVIRALEDNGIRFVALKFEKLLPEEKLALGKKGRGKG